MVGHCVFVVWATSSYAASPMRLFVSERTIQSRRFQSGAIISFPIGDQRKPVFQCKRELVHLYFFCQLPERAMNLHSR